MDDQRNTYVFHVTGMHCRSCELLIEDELKSLPNITMADAHLGKMTVMIDGSFGDKNQDEIANELTKHISKHGYYLSVEKELGKKNWSDFRIAIPVALAFIVAFIIL